MADDITLRPISHSLGVEAMYRRRLQKLVRAMAKDVLRALKAAYEPAADKIGMDAADPVTILHKRMKMLGTKWTARFDAAAESAAKQFAVRSRVNLDAAFATRLREAGFTVRFRPTRRMVAAQRAVMAENINLIRSIPEKFLTQVESTVWSNVMKGYDLHELSKELNKQYRVTHARAALIARDQASKAKAVFEEARRSELGIEEAIWKHSHAGKDPRPTHVAMHNRRYKIATGMWDPAAKKYVWPGTEINCRCSSRSVLPGR